MHAERVSTDVYRLRTMRVNVYFVLDRATGKWVLVDAGMPGWTRAIRRAAHRRFGKPPAAILLTHGHFDQVGVGMGLNALARRRAHWADQAHGTTALSGGRSQWTA